MCKQNKETIDNLLLHCPIAGYIEVFVGNQLFRGVIFGELSITSLIMLCLSSHRVILFLTNLFMELKISFCFFL